VSEPPPRPAAGPATPLPSKPRPITWRLANVVDIISETPRVRTLVLDVSDWPGHRAGQHVDVRLTAEDGYQAQRSYSIASPPEDRHLALTIERLDDGEVSPYLTGELRAGGDGVTQLEASTADGSVFVVRGDERRIAATTGPAPTVGLVFYDLKTCLRMLEREEEAKAAKATKTATRRRTTKKETEEAESESS